MAHGNVSCLIEAQSVPSSPVEISDSSLVANPLITEIQERLAPPLGAPALRFLVRFADNFYLTAYTDEGASLATDQNRARIFRNRQTAEGVAQLLRGEVCEVSQKGGGERTEEPTGARGFHNGSLSSSAILCKIIVELGGGQFCGLFPAIPNRSEPLVLFNSKHKTTLGILLPDLSAEAVRQKLRDSDLQFEEVAG